MVSLAFVISFVVSAVAMIVGIVMYSDIVDDLSLVLPFQDVDSSQTLGQNTASSDQPIAPDTTNQASIYTGLDPNDIVTNVQLSISGVNIGQRVLDVSSEDNKPQGLTFKPDGSRMFMVGVESATVYQYDLSILYDVSTGLVSETFDVSNEDASPQNITISTDGTKLYMIGSETNKVHTYTLSTPFDIGTMTADGFSFGFNNIPDDDIRAVIFTPDGTSMYAVGNQFDKVYQHNLGTAWDLSTKGSPVAEFYVGGQEPSPTSITFKAGGGSFFLIGNNQEIYQYDMIGYSISTSTFITNFPTTDSSTAIAFAPDGLQVFAVKGG